MSTFYVSLREKQSIYVLLRLKDVNHPMQIFKNKLDFGGNPIKLDASMKTL